MARLEDLPVDPDPPPAKVVVSSRNGTVVIGGQVRLRPAAVMQGNVIVTIAEQPQVAQPPPFGGGAPVVTPQTQIGVEQQAPRMFVFDPGATLNDLVQAVNAVGVPPDDLIAILQALKEAGSLHAELEVI
jgi:flagellar P-ring protein precursor FlgI